jgi:glycosyltransferase involved in cell wall biosynthesis
MKYKFHVLGVPHTVTSKEFVACAFTQKAYKFCQMMKARGHTIIHYGHEESQVDCDEHVTVLSSDQWKECYGDYDWRKTTFKYDMEDSAYQTFRKNTIEEIGKRKQPKDFILPFWGHPMKPICDAHSDLITVEPGIGYAGGHFARYKVFESYAIHSAYYGLNSVARCNEDWYDVVIPNYFDANDFEYSDQKEDYFLFLGRVYEGKGVHIAIQVAQQLGVKLVIAGQGSIRDMGYEPNENIIEFGYANAEARKNLMSKAKGAFVASMYNEPFAGVQIECMLSGTPVISTDWGALAELNLHGYTGYRCRTFEHFLWAARNIETIKPEDCRTWGENFLYDKVAPMYEEYFESIHNIYGKKGWYEPNEIRTELNWLRKEYPLNIR